MKSKSTHPQQSALTGAYSPAVKAGGWVFVSGQGPLDPETGRVCNGSIEEETRLTMRNIGTLLVEAGCSFKDVVRCGCHLADIADFDRFNRTYAEFFTLPYPARTTVQSGLGDGIKVEIDCIARVRRKSQRAKR